MTSQSSISYPELYDFPPFFTRQIHEDTWQKQKQIWIEFISLFAQQTNTYELNISTPIFTNKKISRSISIEMFEELMTEFQKQKKGEWIDKSNTFVFYHKPVEEWVKNVTSWIKDTHIPLNFICTVYELSQSLNNPHPTVLKKTLDQLEKSNHITLISNEQSNTMEYGIKFIRI